MNKVIFYVKLRLLLLLIYVVPLLLRFVEHFFGWRVRFVDFSCANDAIEDAYRMAGVSKVDWMIKDDDDEEEDADEEDDDAVRHATPSWRHRWCGPMPARRAFYALFCDYNDLIESNELSMRTRLMERLFVVTALAEHIRLWRGYESLPDQERSRAKQRATSLLRRSPIIITGFARAGTTILHRLLACDKKVLAPIMAELRAPWPPPGANAAADASRLCSARLSTALLRHLNPRLSLFHDIEADKYEECMFALMLAMVFPVMLLHHRLPRYERWLTSTRAAHAYADYHLILQVLGMNSDGSKSYWLLKAPQHTFSVRACVKEFKEARFVFCSRSATDNFLSVLGLAVESKRVGDEEGNVDVAQVAAHLIRSPVFLGDNADATLRDIRECIVRSRFCHCDYDEFLQDPVAMAMKIRRHFKLGDGKEEEEAVVEREMHELLRQHQQHRLGRPPKSTLADAKLQAETIQQYYEPYFKTFINKSMEK